MNIGAKIKVVKIANYICDIIIFAFLAHVWYVWAKMTGQTLLGTIGIVGLVGLLGFWLGWAQIRAKEIQAGVLKHF